MSALKQAYARLVSLFRLDALDREFDEDAHRDSRGLAWLDGTIDDLRFALRGLRRER